MIRQLFLIINLSLLILKVQAQTPIIDSWVVNSSNTIAQYYNSSGVLQNTGKEADITRLCYSSDSVWIETDGMPAIFGPWLNPGSPVEQNFTFRFPRNPASATVKTEVPSVFAIAVLLNGAVIFGNGDSRSYQSSTNTNVSNGDGLWNGNAYYTEGFTLDTTYAGHVNQDGTYHSHATPFKLYKDYPSTQHSPIVGFAFDGYPIYGPFGYSDPMDAGSAIQRMESSYQLRSISTRTTLPDGTTSNPAGPAVDATFPLGMYIEDYEYISALGDLDEYNGRFCVTPEYPSGTYAYFVTTESDGSPKFPFYIGEYYYGVVDEENLAVDGSITIPATTTACLPASSGPSVTLSVNPASIAENGGTSTVTATLSATTTSTVTVSLAFSGTATVTSDYTYTSATISIPAGSLSGTVTVTGVDDASIDGGETIIIDISSVTNGTESGGQQKTITITDDEVSSSLVTLMGPPTTTIAENGGSYNLGVSISPTTSSTVTVTLGFSGTATSGTDYSATTTVTIPANMGGGPATITAVQDLLDEADETIIVDIISVTNATESGTQQKTLTITDDDNAPTVTLSASPLSISETGGASVVTATLSAASGYDVTVNLSASGTASGSGVDYTLSATSISIPAGNTTGSVTVTSASDTKDENNETVIIDISSVTNATESTTQQVTVTINDDDAAPSVTLSANPTSISETSGSSTVTATLSAASDFDVTVNLSASGTATGSGTDYTLSASSITITAGNTSGTVMVSAASDIKDENDETVIIDISTVTNGTEATTQQVTVTITDDDAAPTVTLSANPTSISETSGSSIVTATLSAASDFDVTVNLSASGTATGSGTDYTLSASSITITAGNTSGTATVSAASDTKDENDETVIIDISTVTNGTEATTQQVTVTITDDDAAPTVTLSANPTSISETSGSSIVTATLSAASDFDVTVNLSASGTATGSGTDYTLSASSITITAGNTTGTATISSVSDASVEGDETVILDISTVTNGSETGTQTVTITITDDDVAPGSPEINITENGATISNAGTFNFGTVNTGSSVTKTFTLENTGDADLIVSSGVSISGTDASEFNVNTTSFSGTIAGSSSTTFSITFTPACGSGKSATISIASNDSDENPYTFTLSGTANDATAPVPSVASLPDATDECEVTLTAPTATDNCAGTITATTTDPLTYSSQGNYTVTWTYDDGNGNTVTQTQNVVIDDITAPVITCPADLNVNSSIAVVVNYDPIVVTENCSSNTLQLTAGLASGSTFPTGVTTVTYEVADAGGQSATCSFDVNVEALTPVYDATGYHFNLYPNPGNGLFHLESDLNIQSVVVRNLEGEIIFKMEDINSFDVVDMSELNEGMYFMQVTSEYGMETMKINIQK